MRIKDAYIIWLNYIDRRLTKKEGRKLPKNQAIKSPTIEELSKAASKMGYRVREVRRARYPSSWWIDSGYIVIDKPRDEKKLTIIKKIAKEIRRQRGG